MTPLLRFFRTWAIAPVAAYKMMRHDGFSIAVSAAAFAYMVVSFPFFVCCEGPLAEIEDDINEWLTLTR